jgi:hypothetical protein
LGLALGAIDSAQKRSFEDFLAILTYTPSGTKFDEVENKQNLV